MRKDPKLVTLVKVISLVLDKSTAQTNTASSSALVARNRLRQPTIVVTTVTTRPSNGKHYTYCNKDYYTESECYIKYPYLKAVFDKKRVKQRATATAKKKAASIPVIPIVLTVTATKLLLSILYTFGNSGPRILIAYIDNDTIKELEHEYLALLLSVQYFATND